MRLFGFVNLDLFSGQTWNDTKAALLTFYTCLLL